MYDLESVLTLGEELQWRRWFFPLAPQKWPCITERVSRLKCCFLQPGWDVFLWSPFKTTDSTQAGGITASHCNFFIKLSPQDQAVDIWKLPKCREKKSSLRYRKTGVLLWDEYASKMVGVIQIYPAKTVPLSISPWARLSWCWWSFP